MTNEKNPAAVALGKLAKGKPKKFARHSYTREELERRKQRLDEARKKRWPKSEKET